MAVASILLILVAVVLLAAGLAGGSGPLLITSIGASLLAAVALVVGARQAAATRATTDRTARRRGGPATSRSPYGAPVVEPEIPVQHVPPTVGTGWRQPPEPPSGSDLRPRPAPGPGTDEAPADEPAVQRVRPEDAALVAELRTPVHVVQGRPRYHLAACPHLLDRLSSRLPVAEAIELGFTPCARCTPDTTLLAHADPS
ncbi:hypothetical protein GA0070624_5874 [Micromonospora rhizosphaerae]|uniref:Clumping factor A n=1 Tax=Micromonospora rhizosphaerae TaxID=568872 RepID=A0A1C6T6K2_9ACTN|nr:hypothetical protein [Micromonospora rhizosphaerae]SCL37446.1 hypothetical protein GA0070624_5874 [Micromonospora rhizosphaerae]